MNKLPPVSPSTDITPPPATVFYRSKKHLFAIGLAVIVLVTIGILIPQMAARKELKQAAKNVPATAASSSAADQPAPVVPTHVKIPAEVRGLYVTAATAGDAKRFDALVTNAVEHGMNALVVDLKGDSGALAFEPTSEALKDDIPAKTEINDLDAVIKKAHDNGLYLIARYPVFEDPDYATRHQAIALKRPDGGLWRDRRGLAWLDPAAEEAWQYNVDIAKEAYARGLDEIQFDYVRFATDGDISRIVFPVYDKNKESFRDCIGRFFAFLDVELRGQGIPISADLFGFTTWHQSDMGIGQWYADALKYMDFVSPMVYPSHYPAGTLGLKNPAANPYAIVLDSLEKGNEVIAELKAADPDARIGTQRPWIQAFDMGAVYTTGMQFDQAKAARETGSTGFLYWNAANRYPTLPDFGKQ